MTTVDDLASMLAGELSSLSFPNDNRREEGCFRRFAELPTELRLKIYNEAEPAHHVLRLTVHILLYDPSFGFYTTFFLAAEDSVTLLQHTRTAQLVATETAMNQRRGLPLLRVCRESRGQYLEDFPIGLPYGLRGSGRLYISKEEIVYLTNTSDLLHNDMFQQAMKDGYRLQSWWAQIQKLAVPVASLIVRGKDWQYIATLCRQLPNLRELRGVMWDHFQDTIDSGTEANSRTIRTMMDMQLQSAKSELAKIGREDGTTQFRVPELLLMDKGSM